MSLLPLELFQETIFYTYGYTDLVIFFSLFFQVHSLFSMLGLNHAYVTAIGRIIGVVALKEVCIYLSFFHLYIFFTLASQIPLLSTVPLSSQKFKKESTGITTARLFISNENVTFETVIFTVVC